MISDQVLGKGAFGEVREGYCIKYCKQIDFFFSPPK
jgi:hypothetical protein